MMLNEPGLGCHVLGELYEVDERTMADLDQLESVGQPGNLRVPIEVERTGGGPALSAFAYMKARSLAEPAHSDYLELYDDWRFIAPDHRQQPSQPES
jgi:gamma-glutamylaminecyclotransferase